VSGGAVNPASAIGPMKLLLALLGLVAGSADVITFLGLGGLFVAHITGNLVILAAHVVTDTDVGVAVLLSVPVFVLALALTRLLAERLLAARLSLLRPLLVAQFLLLAGLLGLVVAEGRHLDPDAVAPIVAGMLGVAAMAVQNALVDLALPGAPTTAVMTTNITRFTLDVVEAVLRPDTADATEARRRAARTWPAIAGFGSGAALGAASFAAVDLVALTLPTALALLTIAVAASAGDG
jgi:uncharacterized membrane protein YoaK (UPF0700 family)